MTFEPIAITGRSCIFPGSFTPEQFWSHVEGGHDLVSSMPSHRMRVEREAVVNRSLVLKPDTTFTDRGGYVEGFESIFDPGSFDFAAREITPLDQLFHWLLHTGVEALRNAGINAPIATPKRTGAVFGLLALPSEGFMQFAESVWLQDSTGVDPRNRFCGGFTAHLLARALGLDEGAFAIDAACASSLYAIKLACDMLQDSKADMMLAGAVSRADPLYLQIGFSALSAVSPSGRSRPLSSHADGLLPAEGASFLVLKRLEDAEKAGDRIYGVIRGIGTGNDGRTALTAPSEVGQADTIRAAYRSAGLDPAQISLVECHATGTRIGDACEIKSMGSIFAGLKDIPIGSVKSNLGHPMAAAGMAGVLKVLGAFETGIRPRMLHVDSPGSQNEQLEASPFRLLAANESWNCKDVRRAAVSSFGFGGNNAHLILEEWRRPSSVSPKKSISARSGAIAVVSAGAVLGDAENALALSQALFSVTKVRPHIEEIGLEWENLGFPPHDLEQSLPSQIAALRAATEAITKVASLPAAKTGVIVGTGIDPDIARLSLHFRRRLPPEHPRTCRHMTGPAVIGLLANIVANRISSKYGLQGVSFAVLSEETSGMTALDVASRLIRRGDLDAAIVGACDLSCEEVHRTAIAKILPQHAGQEIDAAAFLVLKPMKAATAAGDQILVVIPDGWSGDLDSPSLPELGYPHAAYGFLKVFEAALCCAHGALGVKRPWLHSDLNAIRVHVSALGGASASILMSPGKDRVPLPVVPLDAPRVFVYAGSDDKDLIRCLRASRQGEDGNARLAIVASSESEWAAKRERALKILQSSPVEVAEEGIYYRARPLGGSVAFVFPGAAVAYQGAGASLLLAFPEALTSVRRFAPQFLSKAAWLYGNEAYRASPVDKLWGCTAVAQCHAHLTQNVFGVHADAAIGLSSGETNALFAFKIWRDPDQFGHELLQSELFERHLGGTFDVLGGACWETWQFNLPDNEMLRISTAEPELRILAIHMPGEYLTGGQPDVMKRAVRLAGAGRAQRVDFDLVIHAPEAAPFAKSWHRLHRRTSYSPPNGTRFYQMAGARVFDVNSDSVADSLTAQMLGTLDFPKLIENAWKDGTRVFLEHGPRGSCSRWIRHILSGKEHAAIPLDIPGLDSLTQTANALAQLFVAGAQVNVDRFNSRLVGPAITNRKQLRIPGHPPAVAISKPVSPQAATTAAKTGFVQHSRKVSVSLFEEHATALATVWSGYLQHSWEAFGSVLNTATSTFPKSPSYPRSLPSEPLSRKTAKLTREELELTTHGSISEVFGPLFKPLDGYSRVVRLPMPPMLLADRIVSIDAEPASMSTGSLISETDIVPGAWYLHRGRMPAGIVIESGQADMLLISWLGIDLQIKGERIYRLLGCDLTFHAHLPAPGTTLQCRVRITGHARQGEIRIFFFEYDCYANGNLLATVRNAQAGFFTDRELRESKGILWSVEDIEPRPVKTMPQPRSSGIARTFSQEQVAAAARGDAYSCFGSGFELSAAQQRPPAFSNEKLLLIDSITDLNFTGGPWGRGYLRAEYHIHPDNWLFACHFKDDPCLPGTLMFEGALQAMAFYMMAMGFTLERDGWRFETAPGEPYPLRCRGQATPESKLMVCELFVEEITEGPEPTLYAHVLGLVDGLKAFQCRRMTLRMIPGFPLDEKPDPPEEGREVAVFEGIRLDRSAMLACALGSPVKVFGPQFARFEKYERCPRLPAPPYQFIDRITRLEGEFGSERAGLALDAEFDLSPGDWYFAGDQSRFMAFAALVEVGLQPCGWLSCYAGVPVRSRSELYFRNLDGDAVIHSPVAEKQATLKTHAELIGISRSGEITLTSFAVTISLHGKIVLSMKTGFGFFQREDLAEQVGLPPGPDEAARISQPTDFTVDLRQHPARFFEGPLRLPMGRLLMVDEITESRDNRIRGRKTVHPSDWQFRAHFYGDPVQPGSLGIEAILQTAQCLAIQINLDREIQDGLPEWTDVFKWKYRGQVVPFNKSIQTDVALLAIRREASGVYLDFEGWLWVDGFRIYHMPRFTLAYRD